MLSRAYDRATEALDQVQSSILSDITLLFPANESGMRRRTILSAVRTGLPLLIIGEPGTGKKRLVRTIIRCKVKAIRGQAHVDCSEANAVSLIKHKLYDATVETLVLHRIAKMSLESQAQLESLIEDTETNSLTRHASSFNPPQLITIANPDFDAAVLRGEVRVKLASLLGHHRVVLTKLAERADEIPALIDCILQDNAGYFSIPMATLSPDALDACLKHSWPGNYDELVKTIETACLNCDREISKNDLLFVHTADSISVKSELKSLAQLEP